MGFVYCVVVGVGILGVLWVWEFLCAGKRFFEFIGPLLLGLIADG